MQVVKNEYAESCGESECCQLVTFDQEVISLDIPTEGIVLDSGWSICSMTHPAVSYTCTLNLHKIAPNYGRPSLLQITL